MSKNAPFWKTTPLRDMTREQWESLCDGCARCCLLKLEDIDSGRLVQTSVVCRYLDADTCRCTCYADRSRRVPDCLTLDPERVETLDWLPATCAYRLLAEGRDLPEWHPLVSGDPASVHRAGISVREFAVSEEYVHPDDLEAYVQGQT